MRLRLPCSPPWGPLPVEPDAREGNDCWLILAHPHCRVIVSTPR